MNGKLLVIGILLLVLGAGAGYYFSTNKPIAPEPETTMVETPTATPTEKVMLPTATPTVDEKAAILVGVKAGLMAEFGPDADSMNVTVSKIVGNHSSGSAGGEGGGGMWLAAKVNGTWKLVWDGNGTISCEITDPYNFPVSILPECWNEASGTLKVR